MPRTSMPLLPHCNVAEAYRWLDIAVHDPRYWPLVRRVGLDDGGS
jgi:hypothetical protein